MTGRDLIIYILENGLEDTNVFKNGKINGFLTVKEAAVKLGVGTATILLWYALGEIEGFYVAGELYLLKDIKDPRLERMHK